MVVSARRISDGRLLRRSSSRATLFGESLVAVDLQTGKRKWHYQLVHHGIWDMDIPCAPILADITVNGRTIKAVAQPTKQAFLYVFDRVTGAAHLADRGASRPEGRRARRMVFAHAAISDQAAGVRPPGRVDRRSDRFHAGAARGSRQGDFAATSSGRSSRRRSVSKAEGPIATLAWPTQGAARTGPAGRTIRRRTSCTCTRRAPSPRLGSCRHRQGLHLTCSYHRATC